LTTNLILTSFQIDKREAILSSVADYKSRHKILLEGDVLQGIPMMSDVCKLFTMREVTYLGDNLNAGLVAVIDSGSSEEQVAKAITFMETALPDYALWLTKMKKVEKLFIEDRDECKPSEGIPIEQWSILTNRAGKQRMLSQKAVRLFTNLAAGIMVTESKVDLVMALDAANSNLYELLFGSKRDNVPSPLSKGAAEALGTSKAIWDEMEVDLRTGVTRATIDLLILTRCARLSGPLLTALNNVTSFFVKAAVVHMPSLPATVIDQSGSQRMLMQKMSKEAMLVSLDIDKGTNLLNMKDSMDMWRNSHTTLLRGGVPRSNTSSGVPKATNVCILQQMQHALDAYQTLETALFALTENGTGKEEVHLLNPPAFNEMNKAVSMYGTIGDVGCELREDTVDAFKAALFKVGKLRVLTQRVQKEFLLNAWELNTTIAEISSSFEHLLFGKTSIGVKASPTQALADLLIHTDQIWLAVKSALEDSTAIVTQDSVSSTRDGVEAVLTLDKIEAIMAAYVKLTQDKVLPNELPATKVDLASRQRMLVERMAKEAILTAESSTDDQEIRRTSLSSSMAAYESAHVELIDQTHGGRDRILTGMNKARIAWVEYKKSLLLVADGSTKERIAMQTRLDVLSSILEEVEDLYADVVEEVVPPQRKSFLVFQMSIPLALVCGPSIIGCIRGLVS